MIPSNSAALSRPLAWRTLLTTLTAALGLGLLGACTATVSTAPYTYAPPPPPPQEYAPSPPQQPDYAPEAVVNSSPAPVVEITVESDFYQPLESYGTWVNIDGYGRCWQPRNVGNDWRPYTNGRWVSTDAGWCWQSNESFGWATYHYGRWNQDPQRGWYWVPQTHWAPAWVSWREGGGYAGWAPLPPPPRPGFDVHVQIEPRNFVYVDEHHFSEPVRPSTLIINNTTIINKTVIINNSHVTNNVTVNGGPKRAEIEKATGQTIKPVSVAQIRSREDARSGLKAQVRPTGNSPTVNHSRPAEAQPQHAAAPSQQAHTNTGITVPNSATHDSNTGVAVHDQHQDDVRNAAAEKANADEKAKQAAAAKAHAAKQANASVQEDGSRGQVRRPVDPEANKEEAAKEAAERQSEADTKAKAEAAKSTEAKREAPTRNPEAGEARPTPQQPAQHVNPDAKAQADAKKKADADAKAKADAKKKADAQKAKEDEEKRAEENKTQP